MLKQEYHAIIYHSCFSRGNWKVIQKAVCFDLVLTMNISLKIAPFLLLLLLCKINKNRKYYNVLSLKDLRNYSQ